MAVKVQNIYFSVEMRGITIHFNGHDQRSLRLTVLRYGCCAALLMLFLMLSNVGGRGECAFLLITIRWTNCRRYNSDGGGN